MWVVAETVVVVATLLFLRTVYNQDIGALGNFYFSESNSHLNSKGWFDVCSFGHFKVGMGVQKALSLLPLSENVRHFFLVSVVCLYEIIENNESRLGAWRVKTYTGDSIINSFTDIACAVAGYYFASLFSWVPFLIVFAVFLSIFKCSPKVGEKITRSIFGDLVSKA